MAHITKTEITEFRGTPKVIANCKTPEGTASYPHINKPDEPVYNGVKGKKQYKVDLRVDPKDAESATFMEEVRVWEDKAKITQRTNLEAELAKCKGARDVEKKDKYEAMLKAIDDGKYKSLLQTEYDRDSGDPTGMMLIKSKMNAEGKGADGPYTMEPKVYNATGRVQLADAPQITPASTLRLNLELGTYEMFASGYVGISVRLKDVLIVKIAESGGAGGSNPFGGDNAQQPDTFNASAGLDETSDSDEY